MRLREAKWGRLSTCSGLVTRSGPHRRHSDSPIANRPQDTIPMSLTLPESWDSALIVGRTPWGVPSGPRIGVKISLYLNRVN